MSNLELTWPPAHSLQERKMGSNGTSHSFILYVLNSVFLAGFLDDLTDCRVMYMRDLGKQMVFYLEIKSADKPAYNLVLSRKVSSGF